MKSIVLGLIFAATSVSANTTFDTVKVSDGKTAYCKTKYDLHRAKTGVYTGKAIKAELEEGKINFQVKLNFLACIEKEGKFQFVYKKPYAEFLYKTFTTKDTVSAKASEVHLKAYKDGVYKILTNQKLPDASSQVRNIEVSLEDALNEKQIEQLKNGKTVKGNFDFWISKKMTYTIEAQAVRFNDLVSFGSYRINFEISDSDTGLKINLL